MPLLIQSPRAALLQARPVRQPRYVLQVFEVGGLSFINAGGQVVQSLHFDGKDYPGSGSDAPQG